MEIEGRLMILGKQLAVVMPAYKAEKTLRQTFAELPHEYLDEVMLVDDASSDRTADIARELGITIIIHTENRGYGANKRPVTSKRFGWVRMSL